MDEDSFEEDAPESEIDNEKEGVYSDEERSELIEDDEITAEEEGFMEGADLAGSHAKCANCGKMLTPATTIEKEIEGEVKWFCSEHCIEKFEEKHKEE